MIDACKDDDILLLVDNDQQETIDNINYIQNQSAIEEMIIAEDEKYKITHIALKLPTSNKYNSLLNCAVVGGTKNYDVEKATRNPLNKVKYQITVFMIDRNNVCFLK